MTNFFISFGGPHAKFHKAVEDICNEAKEFEAFEEENVIKYTDEDLKNDKEFWNVHGLMIESNPRGYGYWLWKIYLCYKTMLLDRVKEGDIIVYADSGCILRKQFEKRMNEYIEMCKNSSSGIVVFSLQFEERHWTKMDLFVYLNACENLKDDYQIIGGAFIYKKCENTLKIMKEWFETATYSSYRMLTDVPSQVPNTSDFIEHRHDQSIFSLLLKKYGCERLGYEIEEGSGGPIFAARRAK